MRHLGWMVILAVAGCDPGLLAGGSKSKIDSTVSPADRGTATDAAGPVSDAPPAPPTDGNPPADAKVPPPSDAKPPPGDSKPPPPPDSGPPVGSTFKFISWADTKSGTSTLSSLSNQALALQPAFTVYPGDMISSWSDSLMATWKNAVNGGTSNGMFDITFTVRGNHDASGSSTGYMTWMAANHPLATTAAGLGMKSFTNMPNKDNQVYSFDYANAHFVGLDSTGDADTIGSDQITWLDADLTAAEGRKMVHTFLYFHGPIYCLAEHCSCTTGICKSGIYNLVDVLNKHPSVSATFHGHEHVYAYTYVDSNRDPKVTHPFHQFVTGDAGAGPDTCDTGRYDYWMNSHGFVLVEVAGPKVTVDFYKQGSTTSQKTISWTK